MALIVVTAVSALVVVAALWGAAAIDTWWALVVAMGVHLVTTVIVFLTVAYVLTGHPHLPRRTRRL
jgi:hypothetical protein